MDSIQTKRIAREFLQFPGSRELEGLTNLLSEKVDWYIPGNIEKLAG